MLSKRNKRSKRSKRNKRICVTVALNKPIDENRNIRHTAKQRVFTVRLVLAAVWFAVNMTGCSIDPENQPVARTEILSDIQFVCDKAIESSKEQIKSREPVYVIDLDSYVAPRPDFSKYDDAFDNYVDPTIEVHYYSENMYNSIFHFMDVKIKHPSQLRLALAGNSYGATRDYPSSISKTVNAVAAVSGSFYNARPYGVVIYNRNLLKKVPKNLDVLLIDSEGELHIVNDREIESSGVLENYDIIHAISFGPELVKDGEELTVTKPDWQPNRNDSRTAICTFEDKLHYLICIVEAGKPTSKGIYMQTFAHELAAKGVKSAYNLDGGQTGTMVIGNRLKNRVSWGPQKKQGEILYFATGIDTES